MVKIIYMDRHGTAHEVDVPVGLTLMEGAVRNNVAGIDADCGGACACATCHLYIDPADSGKFDAPDAMEMSMLEFAEHVEPTSRLSCQINVAAEMEGITVRAPSSQY